jgi:hypothetical protein
VVLFRTRQHVLDRCHEGRVADDPQLAVDGLAQLRQRAQAVLGAHLGDVGLEALHLLAGRVWSEMLEDPGDVEARVPDLDVAHRREADHRRPVLTHRRRNKRAAFIVEAVVPSGDCERGESFYIHSNGPGRVSSKSLMLKTSLRSGAAKMPKLERCASPQS